MSNGNNNQQQSNNSGRGKTQRERQGGSSDEASKRTKVPDWLKAVQMFCWVFIIFWSFIFFTGWWEIVIEAGKVSKDTGDTVMPILVVCIGVMGMITQLMTYNYYEDR